VTTRGGSVLRAILVAAPWNFFERLQRYASISKGYPAPGEPKRDGTGLLISASLPQGSGAVSWKGRAAPYRQSPRRPRRNALTSTTTNKMITTRAMTTTHSGPIAPMLLRLAPSVNYAPHHPASYLAGVEVAALR
jgi:hypothetical protein